jgi:hypothetical protein
MPAGSLPNHTNVGAVYDAVEAFDRDHAGAAIDSSMVAELK